MKIVDYNTVKQTMGDTKTVQDFGRFLGEKPHRLGLVASLYQDLTASYLTDGLMNVYYNEKKGSQFQPINSLVIEWDLDVNYIKKVYLAEDGTDTGANGSDITLVFAEKYYDKYDTFVLENRQQLFVKYPPVRLGSNRWSYVCQLVDNGSGKVVDTTYTTKGKYTRLRSNYHPELSERGYSKFQSNTERHRYMIAA